MAHERPNHISIIILVLGEAFPDLFPSKSKLSCDVRSTYIDDVDKETLCCHIPNNFSNPMAGCRSRLKSVINKRPSHEWM